LFIVVLDGTIESNYLNFVTYMINLNEVLVFVKVVEGGSFSAAARALELPRATVSRKVSQLEASLGIRLLHRSTRKLSLTEEGRQYYVKCSSGLNEIEEANGMISATQQKPSGLLRISAPLAGQSGFMCKLITEFLALHEDVNIQLNLTDDLVNLIDDGVDVAFRAGKLEDSSLVARKLGSTQLVLCAASDYLKKSASIQSPKDLKDHTSIIFGHSHNHVSWKLQGDKEVITVPVHGRISVNSMQFALQACLSGLGVSLLPYGVIEEHLKTKKLQLLLKNYSSNVGGLYIVYPSKTHLSTTVRAFVDFVAEKMKGEMSWRQDDL